MTTPLAQRRLYWLIGLIAAVALPIALIGANARIAFNSLPLYVYAIDGFDTPSRTGLSRDELVNASRGLIAYFNSDEDLITVAVRTPAGVTEPLFSPNEALHFRDVKGLLQGVYAFQTAAMLLVLAAVAATAAAVVNKRMELASLVLRALQTSSLVTIAAIVVIGLFAAVGGFNFLYLQFHLLSFSNDLWMGSESDRMVQMFPQAFFFQATMLIGLVTVLEAGLVALAAAFTLRSLAQKEKRAPVTGPAPTSNAIGSP
jgi:integral membrane protein (TIGR01906 family)